MSVTFTITEAPITKVPCPFCQGEHVDFPEGNGHGGKCDRFCTGMEENSTAPEVNLSNANAAAVLQLLGFSGEDLEFGGCSPAILRQRIFRARHQDRSHLVCDPEVIPGGHAGVQVLREDNVLIIRRMGAPTYECGNTDEQTLGRLGRLESLAVWAQEEGYTEISWG